MKYMLGTRGLKRCRILFLIRPPASIFILSISFIVRWSGINLSVSTFYLIKLNIQKISNHCF